MENPATFRLYKGATGALQFGHGGEPWRTGGEYSRTCYLGALQFGHGGEPWRTAVKMTVASMAVVLQFGHGGEPWRTNKARFVDAQAGAASIRPRR